MEKDKKYKSFAWCDCGDALTSCDFIPSVANEEYKRKKLKTKIENTFYCFGCDDFYELKRMEKENGNSNI